MNSVIVVFNNVEYEAIYNSQSGYYEISLPASNVGGIYTANITFTDLYGTEYEKNKNIQIFAKESQKLNLNKVFMWVFDSKDLEVKDIIEISDYELNIDEETNANSSINIMKNTSAKSDDIIVIKKNGTAIYWGIICNIQNENGENLYKLTIKYITNLFYQKIELNNKELIRTTGIEDFLASAITENFIQNTDTILNKTYLEINVVTHTTKNINVSNVESGLYNLHTWMTNCTQKYDIVYDFTIQNKKLILKIESKSLQKQLIDVNAQQISKYSEVFETKVVSKVVVLYDKVNEVQNPGKFTLYLKTDRTTTENMDDENRADGKVEMTYTENYEDAMQTALDIIKSNSYKHKITFSIKDELIKVGTPIAIKTKNSLIFDTYISALKITKNKFIEYTCGNIRIDFIDILRKERGK